MQKSAIRAYKNPCSALIKKFLGVFSLQRSGSQAQGEALGTRFSTVPAR